MSTDTQAAPKQWRGRFFEDLEIPPMRVPTCQLQHGFGADAAGTVPYPAQLIELQTDAEAFYGRRGVSILATCTPYQVGNIPVRGEHCAWMESSAVVYAQWNENEPGTLIVVRTSQALMNP